MMNKSIIGMLVLWITSGGALAVWTPPAITWDAILNQITMFTMVGGRLGTAGLTNNSETLIWAGVTGFSALLIAWTRQQHSFATGFTIGTIGGSIATLIQLLLNGQSTQLQDAQSWLTDVPLDLSAWSVQLGLTPIAGATHGLVLGAVAAGIAAFLAKNKTQAANKAIESV